MYFTPKLIILAVLVIITNGSPLFADKEHDSMLYHFPALHPEKLTGKNFPIIKLSNEITNLTDSLGSDQHLDAEQYSKYKKALNTIADTVNDIAIKTDVKRRLIILDWSAGKIDGYRASEAFKELADNVVDPQEKAFTLAYSMVTDARNYDILSMEKVFDQIKPSEVPQFGWFAFEIAKYYRKYIEQAVSKKESESGKPIKKEYHRMINFANFLEKKFLPALEIYGNKTDLSELEKAQFVSVFAETAKSTRRTLARRMYMDISKRSTESIFPKIINLWEKSIADIDENKYFDKKIIIRNIQKYKDRYIPRIKELQEQKGFMDEFSREILEVETVLQESVEQELIEENLSKETTLPAKVSEDVSLVSDSRLEENNSNIEEDIAMPVDSKIYLSFYISGGVLLLVMISLIFKLISKSKKQEN